MRKVIPLGSVGVADSVVEWKAHPNARLIDRRTQYLFEADRVARVHQAQGRRQRLFGDEEVIS